MKVNWNEKKDELEQLIMSGVPYEKIGRYYGVSGNAVKKAAKKLCIELPIKRIKSDSEHFNRGTSFKRKTGYNECPNCGNLKYHTSKLCSFCQNKQRQQNIKNKTLGYFVENKNYLSTKCSEIRKDAKRTLSESTVEKVCVYCKNHEYDEILEVHHIKGILEHNIDTTINEINAIENLVWLCPNHHAMLEKGLISLKGLIG